MLLEFSHLTSRLVFVIVTSIADCYCLIRDWPGHRYPPHLSQSKSLGAHELCLPSTDQTMDPLLVPDYVELASSLLT